MTILFIMQYGCQCPPPSPSPSDLTLILMLEFQRIYCATNSSSPEVELRFCPWPHACCYNIELGGLARALLSVPIMCKHQMSGPQIKHTYTEWLKNSASVLEEEGLTINWRKKTLYCLLTYCISIDFNVGRICGCSEARDRDKNVCHNLPHEFF